jgi:undecaprenyl-diphosphatase
LFAGAAIVTSRVVQEAGQANFPASLESSAQSLRNNASRSLSGGAPSHLSARGTAYAEANRMPRSNQEARAADAWLAFAGRWGAWAATGVALMFVAGFVELSEEVLGGEDSSAQLLGADAVLLRWVAQLRRPWLNGVAVDLTALGSPLVVALFTFCLGALLLARADRAAAAVLVSASLASGLLTVATKELLERPRPDVVPKLVAVSGLSYPSGHSLASSAVYLTAAFVVARHVDALRERVAAIVFTAMLILLIGASRVYLGVHYPSDVLGGILLGTSLGLLMAVALRRLDHPRDKQPPSGIPMGTNAHSEGLRHRGPKTSG